MRKYTPKNIEEHLDKLHEDYLQKVEAFAQKVMQDKLKYYLEKEGKSFVLMNGFPQCYNESGDRVDLPQVLINLSEITLENGQPFMWYLPEFDPFKQNFSALDMKHFNEKVKNVSENEAVLSCWQSAHMR